MPFIPIKVIPNASKNEVVKETTKLKVRVTAPAIDGKANKAAIEALARYFNIKKREIKIVRGERVREKVINIQQIKNL